MKKYFFAALLFLAISIVAHAQNRNSVWCFGDSAGIIFNGTSTSLFTSEIKGRGSCASISDSLGQLLFYAYTRANTPGNTTLVYNRDHTLMPNGGNVVGEAWYQELVIVPDPGNTNLYYLFCVGETGGGGSTGLYYSNIDISLDSGRGDVTLKNVQLSTYMARDGLIAVKHGNGRDWWIISQRWDAANNEFTEHLVTPSGLTGPFIKYAGAVTGRGIYFTSFSKSASKFIGFTLTGLIELFDFDRCTGDFVLSQTIAAELTASPYPYFWGGAFSPNENFFYLCALGYQHPTYLIQYDLTAPVIAATADTIWTYTSTTQAGGALRLAPDGKIYLSCDYNDGNTDYPYADTTFNTVNNNLSVINYPDSPGVACGFTPFSFNLGAGRCYYGLPNNPEYELGAVVNSMCDTITAVTAVGSGSKQEELHVFYHPGWQVAFINGEGLRGRKFSLQVFDLYGRMIYSEEGSLSSAYFTKDLPFDAFAKGMYIVTLRTDKEVLSKKFVKE